MAKKIYTMKDIDEIIKVEETIEDLLELIEDYEEEE